MTKMTYVSALDVVGRGARRAARHFAAREVVGDVVGGERPVCGVRPVARGALADLDGIRRRGQPRPRPARERVAGAGGIVQRDGRGFDCVIFGIRHAIRQSAAGEVVGDGIGIGATVLGNCKWSKFLC